MLKGLLLYYPSIRYLPCLMVQIEDQLACFPIKNWYILWGEAHFSSFLQHRFLSVKFLICPCETNFAFPKTYFLRHANLEGEYVLIFFIFLFSMQNKNFTWAWSAYMEEQRIFAECVLLHFGVSFFRGSGLYYTLIFYLCTVQI